MNTPIFSIIDLVVLFIFMEVAIMFMKKVVKNQKINIVMIFLLCLAVVLVAWGAMGVISNLIGAGSYGITDVYNVFTIFGAVLVATMVSFDTFFKRRKSL